MRPRLTWDEAAIICVALDTHRKHVYCSPRVKVLRDRLKASELRSRSLYGERRA